MNMLSNTGLTASNSLLFRGNIKPKSNKMTQLRDINDLSPEDLIELIKDGVADKPAVPDNSLAAMFRAETPRDARRIAIKHINPFGVVFGVTIFLFFIVLGAVILLSQF